MFLVLVFVACFGFGLDYSFNLSRIAFHPCRNEISSEFHDGVASNEWYCYKNFNSTKNGSSIDWHMCEEICQEWHPDSHLIWIHSPEEDDFVYANVKRTENDLWLGLHRGDTTTGVGYCNDPAHNWYWEPSSDGQDTGYALSKGEPAFVCGDCDNPCRYLSWCPNDCSYALGYNEACVAMVNYDFTGSPYNGVEKGWSSSMETWGDRPCLFFLSSYPKIDCGCKLKVPKCGEILSTNESVCSSHGYCIRDDMCVCYEGYSGLLCDSPFTCKNVPHTSESVCSGHGQCIKEDLCLCNSSYYGTFCQNQTILQCSDEGDVFEESSGTCYHVFGNGYSYYESMEICKNWNNPLNVEDYDRRSRMLTIHSGMEEIFVRKNVMRINETSPIRKLRLGLRKYALEPKLYPCPTKYGYFWEEEREMSDDTYVVNRGARVSCTAPTTENYLLEKGEKMCFGMDIQFWFDVYCDDQDDNDQLYVACMYKITTCFGVPSSSKGVCNGNGICIGHDQCVCTGGYEGSACTNFKCFGIGRDYTNDVCNGHGQCISPNNCLCDENSGVYGEKCDLYLCHGKLSSDPKVCSGHGICYKTDHCGCDSGYDSFDCSLTKPCSSISDLEKVDYGFGDCYDNCRDGDETKGVFTSPMSNVCYYVGDDSFVTDFVSARRICKDPDIFHPLGDLISIENVREDWFVHNYLKTNHFASSKFWIGMYKYLSYQTQNYDNCPGLTPIGWIDGKTDISYVNSGAMDSRLYCNDMNPFFRYVNPGGEKFNDFIVVDLQNARVPCGYRLHKCNGTSEHEGNVCGGHGFCWENEVCSCEFGYVYEQHNEYKCIERKCFGINYVNETFVCSGHGKCIDNDFCFCDYGWYGNNCSVTVCNGVFSNETDDDGGGLMLSICRGHGECYGPEKCICDDGYFGDTCDNAICNGIPSTYTSTVCNGHGTCAVNNYCECFNGSSYSGFDCEKWKCYGYWNYDSIVCSGGGECIDEDECECVPDVYFGEKCENTICYGIFSNDTNSVCNNGTGTCIAYETCDCHDINVLGNCDIFICFGINQDLDPNNTCSGHGDCVWGNTCNCTDLNYDGTECQFPKCKGISSSNTSFVCSGHGNCSDVNKCFCDDFWFGKDCEFWSCNNIPKNESDIVCTGHGECVSQDNCTCESDLYYGKYCHLWPCFNITSNNVKVVCGGHGNCYDHDKCYCQLGYDSEFLNGPCTEFKCGEYDRKDIQNVCSKHGKCIGSNICECDDNYSSKLCDIWKCTGFEYQMTESCSGHGRCVSPDKCDCDSMYYGSGCDSSLLITAVIIPGVSVTGIVIVIIAIIIVSSICLLCCVVMILCFCFVCLMTGFLCYQFLRVKKYSRLKNVDILLKEQKLEDDTSFAKININKELFVLNFEDVKVSKILGEGGSNSVVYLATWFGRSVAFKCFKTRSILSSQDSFDEFEKEVAILSSLSHHNIIRFFGASIKPPRVGIVMEYCENGELLMFLEKYRKDYGCGVILLERLRMCHEVAMSLDYIHSKNVIHRDLKSENVLLDSNLTCKLMDFGLSRMIERVSVAKTKRVGTNMYMAPEIVTNAKYDEKCDTFSYGILLWVIICEDANPYDDLYNIEIKVASYENYRPDVLKMKRILQELCDDDECNNNVSNFEWIIDLAINCWNHKSKSRPSFENEIGRWMETWFQVPGKGKLV